MLVDMELKPYAFADDLAILSRTLEGMTLAYTTMTRIYSSTNLRLNTDNSGVIVLDQKTKILAKKQRTYSDLPIVT